jgi:hypothetical protein
MPGGSGSKDEAGSSGFFYLCGAASAVRRNYPKVRWPGCRRPTVRIGAAFSRKAGNSVGGVPFRPCPVDDAASAA